MQKLTLFLQEAQREFKRVNWPTYGETVRLTIVVITISLLTAVFLGLFDLIFFYGLEYLLLFK